MEKKCCTCKEVKDLSEFTKKGDTFDGLDSRCRSCIKIWRRGHYLKHKDAIQAKTTAYRHSRKTDLNVFIIQMHINMADRAKRDLRKFGAICSKEYFYDFAHKSDRLKMLYRNWQESGFKKGLTPSIDRIDFRKGYVQGNLQFISFKLNMLKGFYEAMLKEEEAITHITHP